MVMPITRDLIDTALQAGYQVLAVEHPRSTRWLLTVRDSLGTSIMLVIQARSLIGAADVQDLDELVRVRQLQRGMFWAYGGTFSSAAQRTCAELGAMRLLLCSSLPPASRIER